MATATDVTPGEYVYHRPDWVMHRLNCTVERADDGSRWVRFRGDHYPVRMTSIPPNAIFVPREAR